LVHRLLVHNFAPTFFCDSRPPLYFMKSDIILQMTYITVHLSVVATGRLPSWCVWFPEVAL